MELGQDSAVFDSVTQPGEVYTPGEPVHVSNNGTVGLASAAVAAGLDPMLVGPLELVFTKVGKKEHQLIARLCSTGDVVAIDTVDLARASHRQRLVAQLLEALDLPEDEPELFEAELEQRLLQFASNPPVPTETEAATLGPEFHVVSGAAVPAHDGLYLSAPADQIANFDLRVLEHVILTDEEQREVRLKLAIRRQGQERTLEMTAAEFASNGRLRTAVYDAALPGADLKAGADVLRRAAIALSTPAVRHITTATGWTEDFSQFLVPGGHVDADGYHADNPDQAVPRVDLGGYGGARWLGLRRLDPNTLRGVKEHVALELTRLHEPGVIRALLATAALAPLRGLAAPRSRPIIWFRGLTGSGKTFLASLLMNFFGDFPLDAGGRMATWTATPNYLEALGFYVKDCPLVIDDFKPEMSRRAHVMRLLQNAADGTARGRLRHDMTARATRLVRGLLVATGEDFPMQNASGRARSIVVEVPNRTKDLDLGRRCAATSPLYRGLMADFLAWIIREGRGAVFAERVEHWQGRYYEPIAGEQNDARIAGNHALLAAAFELMADYLSDIWPESAAAAEEFATVDVAGMVAASVSASAEDQGSAIFLETLRALLDWGRVRLESPGTGPDSRGRGPVVGRIASGVGPDGGPVVELSVAMALQAVQRSLSQQGKPPLQVSEKTLIAQLAADGLLLDGDDRPGKSGCGGSRSRQVRIEQRRVRVIRMSLGDLIEGGAAGAPSPAKRKS